MSSGKYQSNGKRRELAPKEATSHVGRLLFCSGITTPQARSKGPYVGFGYLNVPVIIT
jgi:hypothetical protein